MTASAQLDRIVSLVAELSRAAREDETGRPLVGLSRKYRVPARQIAADIRTLTTLCDHAEAEWLLSVSAWQQDERVSVTSLGPFQRPVKLSPDEALALRVALAMDPQGKALAAKLAAAKPPAAPAQSEPESTDVHALFVTAVQERRPVHTTYAGEGDAAGKQDRILPHEVVAFRGFTYVHAWAEQAGGWRLFRLDRFLDARPEAGASFTPRTDFEPVAGRSGLFRAPAAAVEHVRVRFSARVARWVRERYPRCEDAADGNVVVTFLATSVEWLVRRVLEYGPDAEVLGPGAYREAVRRAVA